METAPNKTRVVILTGSYRVHGQIDLVVGARVTDFMLAAKDFIPVTDAEVRDLTGRQISAAAFVDVSREHIQVIAPEA